jgi:GTPase SAR1 family protein
VLFRSVVGDQSSGKSALLGQVTGLHFPVNAGICTKAACVVECKHEDNENGDDKDDVYEIMGEDGRYRKVDTAEELGMEISNLQAVALQAQGNVKISKDEIRVRVRGPQQVDLIVIDLPGIINQGEGEAETKELIDKYIMKDQTLILLISEAKQDDELTTAIALARKADPEGNRTLR